MEPKNKAVTTEITGLLKEVKEYPKKDGNGMIYEHIIVQPAEDEYEFPKSFPVRSEKMLAPLGTVFTALAEVRCFRSRGFYNINLWAV
jgi:hypothetical protein